MARVVFEGHACVNCVMVIANADTSGIEDFDRWESGVYATGLLERMSERYGSCSVYVACPEDCEGEYRTDECDYCGSALHGERHPIVVLAEQ